MSIEPIEIEIESTENLPVPDEPVSVDRPRPVPVEASERILAVDALRGFALLGILAMNIVDFAWPDAAYSDPLAGGGFTGSDRVVWYVNHLFFEAKMMTLFSMLFGAGLVLMDQRAAGRGASIRGVYYRRVLWLLAIGMAHAYLVWSGDILVLYAECGLFLYFFRNLSARALVATGITLLLLIVPLVMGLTAGLDYMKAVAARVEAQRLAGETPRPRDLRLHDIWTRDVQKHVDPTPEQKRGEWDKSLAIHRGGYAGIVRHRAGELPFVHIMGLIFGVLSFAGGRMLLGMGLLKLGVFSAARSNRFYATLAVLGYGIGLPMMVLDAERLIAHGFSSDYMMCGGYVFIAFGSVIVALGHVGAMMLLVKSGVWSIAIRRLSAVGRMALTNYLMQSIVGTTLFYGYGFGLFGTIPRTGLAAIVVAIWAVQLALSPIWLRHFRYGPAEWLWRSLTYWRPQPIRAPAVAATGAAIG